MGQQIRVRQLLERLAAESGQPVLRHLCRACDLALDVDGVSFAVISGQTIRETVCASDANALKADQLEFSLGEGPCLSAYLTGEPVMVANLERDGGSRWPAFTAAVLENVPEIRAMYGFPLRAGAGQGSFGALSLYRKVPSTLSPDLIVEIEEACALVAPLILENLPTILQTAGVGSLTDARHQSVYHAIGVIMAGTTLTSQDAFALMQAHAYAQGRVVEDLAEDILAGQVRLTDLP